MATIEKPIKARYQQKHDTASNWKKAVNFIPKEGELIIYDKDNENLFEAPKLKVGNGVTAVNDLPFVGAEQAESILNLQQELVNIKSDIVQVIQIITWEEDD